MYLFIFYLFFILFFLFKGGWRCRLGDGSTEDSFQVLAAQLAQVGQGWSCPVKPFWPVCTSAKLSTQMLLISNHPAWRFKIAKERLTIIFLPCWGQTLDHFVVLIYFLSLSAEPQLTIIIWVFRSLISSLLELHSDYFPRAYHGVFKKDPTYGALITH